MALLLYETALSGGGQGDAHETHGRGKLIDLDKSGFEWEG